jgi:hypothetical protein
MTGLLLNTTFSLRNNLGGRNSPFSLQQEIEHENNRAKQKDQKRKAEG